MTIEEAATTLDQKYKKVSIYNHVGVGKDELYLYLEKKINKKDLPSEWEGFPVIVRVVGKLKML